MSKLNYENLIEAINILNKQIELPVYYQEFVNPKVNLLYSRSDCCPLHDEDSPSFMYFDYSNTFCCFGCDAVGGVVELHHKYVYRDDEEFTKTKAVMELAKHYNIEIPDIFQKTFTLDEIIQKTESKLKPVKRESVKETYTEEYLMNRVGKGLQRLKNKDMNKYIEKCLEMDKILFVDDDTIKELKELLDSL